MQTRAGNYIFVSNNCCQTKSSFGNPVGKSNFFQQMQVGNELTVTCEQYLSVLTPNHFAAGLGGGGGQPYKNDGGDCRKFEKNFLRGS